ncbi:MAG: glycosyltransferase family 39 protein, partial [Planctomycetes bacterium]|nr:glycosyltransferase family 39 protein [Planctomycetota bacterium]
MPVDSPRNRRYFGAVLCAGMLAGGVLRFAGLGNRDFWFDESCTFIYVHNLFDWPEDSSLLVESTNLPYYFVLQGWVALFGDSETAYRAMSALAATLVIPLLGFLAWRMAGVWAGSICVGLVALNPLHIYYAHEARAYALWTLVLSLALLLLYEAAKKERWRWWTLYGVVLLFALHLHYFTVYWVPATVAAAFMTDQRARCLRRWLITTVAVGAGFVPYFFLAVWPAARAGGSAWVAEHWEPLAAIPQTLWAFLPAGGYPAHLRGLSLASVDTVRFSQSWLIAVTAVVRVGPAIIVVVVSALLVRRRWLNQRGVDPAPRGSSPHSFLAMMTLLPLVLA